MWCKAPRAGLDRRYTNFNDYYLILILILILIIKIIIIIIIIDTNFFFSHLSKTHFHNKGLHLVSFWKREFLELGGSVLE